MNQSLETDMNSAVDYPSEHQVAHQKSLFAKGTNYTQLLRPCTVGDGIIRLSKAQKSAAVELFNDRKSSISAEKFVPASGAASRMFKRVFQWIENSGSFEEEINRFFRQAEKLPCFDIWMEMADEKDVETFQSGLESKVRWLKLLVEEEALGFASKPKGLLPFHQHGNEVLSPIYEHLFEADDYAQEDGTAKLHFTVSNQHLNAFQEQVEQALMHEDFTESSFSVSYSSQLKETDTIALREDGSELKNELGEPVLRPGGHGSLIHNLNLLSSDLVFIKNIDNVCHRSHIKTTLEYKKALAGVLLQLRDDLKLIHHRLNHKGVLDEIEVQEIRDKWNIRIPKEYHSLKAYLNRPVRVCGMVKNEGEPGGGPFWCKDPEIGESVQIVESAQINAENQKQKGISKQATHFNPVDLVCYLKNLEEQEIDLNNYIDEDAYFIAEKSMQGKSIQALEWPGLWNGAMANWITLFVEVPIITFNPVKEFRDLLRPEHLFK